MVARTQGTILAGAYADMHQHPMINVNKNGSNGYATVPSEFVSLTNHVQRDGFAILLEAPAGYASLPDPETCVGILKNIIENYPEKIEGFNAGLKIQTAETPFGRTLERLEDPTRVERDRSTPKLTITERAGMPVSKFIEYTTRYLIGDPETQTALISTLSTALPTDHMNDVYTFTWIFIVPDVTHRFVLQSWLVLGSFFKNNGEITGRKDVETAGEVLKLDLDVTGVCLYRVANDTLAQDLLDQINLTRADPAQRASVIADIASVITGRSTEGYKAGVEELGNTSLAA